MRKTPAAVGIILLLAAFVTVGLATIGRTGTYFDWTNDPGEVEVTNSWNVSRILETGDWFKVEIYAPQDWENRMEPSGSPYPVPHKPVFVNITDPNGGESEMLCDFFQVEAGKALVFGNISDVTETHGISNVHFDPPLYGTKPGIVAQALSSGNYTASITIVVFGGSQPYIMRFVKATLVTENVNLSYLFYPGAIMLIGGVVLVLYGFDAFRLGRKRKISRKD